MPARGVAAFGGADALLVGRQRVGGVGPYPGNAGAADLVLPAGRVLVPWDDGTAAGVLTPGDRRETLLLRPFWLVPRILAIGHENRIPVPPRTCGSRRRTGQTAAARSPAVTASA
ncbi:hypothetical protein Acsp03_21170 [Actinomadura sp. NBRC 104412]|nr:hypothetical protein Acsp03_21170 [Actinomadura sp. NBRC 104412]